MPSNKKGKSWKKKYGSFFNTRREIPHPEPKPGNSMEGIYPLLDEFKSSLEEIDPVQRNLDANMLQKMNEDKDRSDQKVQELEGSL